MNFDGTSMHSNMMQHNNSSHSHNGRGKQLTLSINEDPMSRSISASPQPGGHHHEHQQHEHEDSPFIQDGGSSGEGEMQDSQFGRAPKSAKQKRKAAPRTSRACLGCRRQKMRCEGADNPPCRRCVANEVDCLFERRSDYLLNPEDRAWQNGVEKRLEHLSRAVDQILAHMGGPFTMPPPHTAASFPDMASAAYYDQFERAGSAMPPNTAPVGQDMSGRVNYVIPNPGETAAIAARSGGMGMGGPPGSAGMKRARGVTMPSHLHSAGFGTPGHPDSGFQLFSPRTGGLDSVAGSSGGGSSGLGQPPYAFTTGSGQATSGYTHPLGSYAFEAHHPSGGSAMASPANQADLVPRSLHSPAVRFAPAPASLSHTPQMSHAPTPSPLSGPSQQQQHSEETAA